MEMKFDSNANCTQRGTKNPRKRKRIRQDFDQELCQKVRIHFSIQCTSNGLHYYRHH